MGSTGQREGSPLDGPRGARAAQPRGTEPAQPRGMGAAQPRGTESARPHGVQAARPQAADLSDTERMLIQLRDDLYDGDWDLFVADLEARLAGEPHVFEIGPASEKFKETVAEHLRLIARLRES